MFRMDHKPESNIRESFGTVSGHEGPGSTAGRMSLESTGIMGAVMHVMQEYPKPVKDFNSSEKGGSSGFNSFDSYQEAVDCFINNPAKLLSKDTSEVQRLQEYERGHETRYEVTGDYLDIGRYLDDEPECFGMSAYGIEVVAFVDIIVSIGKPHWVSQTVIAASGEALQNMIYALERNNFRCRITFYEENECSRSLYYAKDFGDHLAPTDIAVATSPDFHRRLGFRIAEHSKTISWGYGSGVSTDEHLMKDESLRSKNVDVTVLVAGRAHDEFPSQMEALAKRLVSNNYSRGEVCKIQ